VEQAANQKKLLCIFTGIEVTRAIASPILDIPLNTWLYLETIQY